MEPRWAKGFSLSQALDMLAEDDDLLQNVDEIFLEPPDPNVDTDEDSADEEEGGMMCNLNGRQLLAPAEIKLVNNDRIGASCRCDEPENNAPERQVTQTIPLEMDANVLFDPESEWITNRFSTRELSKWIPGDIQPMPRQFPEPDYSRYKDMSPVELFELRREIVQVYLTKYKTIAKVPGRSSRAKNVLPALRFDRMDHFVVSCNRRRCVGTGCKSFGRTMCKKCDVGLCLNCFATYHTN